MFKLIALISTLGALGSALAFEEGFKVACNSEFVIGREAHRDHFFEIPRIQNDYLSIKLISQDYICGRKQDDKQKDVYQWMALPNKELPYNLTTYSWNTTVTTIKPEHLGQVHLNSDDDILFEDAPLGLTKTLNPKIWLKDDLKLVTLNVKLKDLLGKKMAKDLLEGKSHLVRVNLVARREFYTGGERFILEIKRESNGKLYSKLIKK